VYDEHANKEFSLAIRLVALEIINIKGHDTGEAAYISEYLGALNSIYIDINEHPLLREAAIAIYKTMYVSPY
jgi:hypothetical protein